jgi:LPXTG-motif cell wall-anchored protein
MTEQPTEQPNGRVEIGDIKAKLTEIDTEVRGAAEVEGPSQKTTTLIVVGAAVVLVAAAFLLGRRRGRRKSTWVEIRRL